MADKRQVDFDQLEVDLNESIYNVSKEAESFLAVKPNADGFTEIVMISSEEAKNRNLAEYSEYISNQTRMIKAGVTEH